MGDASQSRLLTAPIGVINIGLEGFAQELAGAGAPVRTSTGRRRPAAMPSWRPGCAPRRAIAAIEEANARPCSACSPATRCSST